MSKPISAVFFVSVCLASVVLTGCPRRVVVERDHRTEVIEHDRDHDHHDDHHEEHREERR